MVEKDIKVGDVLTNFEVAATFGCGVMGGMRRNKETNTLVLISDATKGFFDDVWKDDVLLYTGMGKTGDQSLDYKQNKTLRYSNQNNVSLHLFEVFEERKYTYRGRVKLINEPYQDTQVDINNNPRKVWIFPLRVIEPLNYVLDREFKTKQERKKALAKRLSDSELEHAIDRVRDGSSIRYVLSSQYERNPLVAEYTKRKAKGLCKLCGEKAPFNDMNNEPFLEVHHIKWLSEGGEDTISNTVALCPNCHRKIHVLNREEDNQKLQ